MTRKMMDEKVMTKHPLGKSGRNIDKNTYNVIKKAILLALRKNELTHTELFSRLNKTLKVNSQEISVGMAKRLNSIWKPEK